MIRDLLKKVVEGKHLSRHEAKRAMEAMMEGKVTSAQMASLLTSLRMKGETVEELLGFALGMRAHAAEVHAVDPQAVDTCGTGGDGGKTFNISTAAALVAAAAGVPIVKHGNRAVSGKSGSADVLEALGIDIHHSAKEAQLLSRETGICFLFAPLFHRAMKQVMPTRTELGFRTCFNLLGPLSNPAKVKYQLMGVYDPGLTEKVAYVLRELGVIKALVVAGLDGLDEMTVTGPTRISEVSGDIVRTYELVPEDVGLPRSSLEEIQGGDARESAERIRRIFRGERGAPRNVVLLNAGAVLYVAGKAATFAEGVSLAADAIDSGAAARKLEQVVRMSQEVRYVS